MVDVHESLPKDGFAVPLRLHNVLLALAGRLDDSALSEARELVARSHLDDAAELAVGALIAGRIMVRPAEQRELALVLEMSRSDATLADHLTVGESVPGHTHRFSRENDPERGVAEALERTLQVLPDLRSVHAVWRNTPAGSVPGPLPQRVVLIEIGPEAHPPAVAFRVDDALRRAGLRAVVEVTGPGVERTEYHEAALAAATPVWLASNQPSTGSDSWSSPKRRSAGGRARTGTASARTPSHAAAEPAGGSEPDPEPEPVDIPPARRAAREAPPESVTESVTEPVEPPAGPVPAEPAEPVGTPTAEVSGDPAPAPEQSQPEQSRVDQPRPGPGEATTASVSPPEELTEPGNRAAETTELTREEVAQLRAAIAEDPEKGRVIAGLGDGSDIVDLPELDLDDPQLSERDRQLLRELHAELAERERAEAARARTNGVQHHWSD